MDLADLAEPIRTDGNVIHLRFMCRPKTAQVIQEEAKENLTLVYDGDVCDISINHTVAKLANGRYRFNITLVKRKVNELS